MLNEKNILKAEGNQPLAMATKTCYVAITGGVISGLGKGVTAATLGALLEARGLRVAMMKMDPYLNVDAGTMAPGQHGEPYVLDDGTEVDLDFGHYERFTNCRLSRQHSVTSGQIYLSVIDAERRGLFLGQTVQVIPHVTDEIKRRLAALASPDTDVAIVEIGGTVGDIESTPFIEALRQFSQERPVYFIHITLVLFQEAAGELKTKPSQQSVAKLRELGIAPNALVCRTDRPLPADVRQKLGVFCGVPLEAIVEARDVSSVYLLPGLFAAEGLDRLVVRRLFPALATEPDLSPWLRLQASLSRPLTQQRAVRIAVVGKYMSNNDSYKSIYEALSHSGIALGCRPEFLRIDAESVVRENADAILREADGILVPGGFGPRGVEGMVAAAAFSRQYNVPYFGICLGVQILVIEFARAIGLTGATSAEFAVSDSGAHLVVDLMESQKGVTVAGATMRLGSFPCAITPGSLAHAAYSGDTSGDTTSCDPSRGESDDTYITINLNESELLVRERHRHRYEINNKYLPCLTALGMRVSGLNPELDLVEIVEIGPGWHLGTQFHPEFQSKPTRPHPLFLSFLQACLKQ